MSGNRSRRRPASRILAIPACIALLTLIGLIAGLLGDGWNDGIAWFGIGLPVMIIAWYWIIPRRSDP